MRRGEALYVFCYDVTRNGARRRVSEVLEGVAVRVQRSVFEGIMSTPRARRAADAAARELDPGDSLRVYAVTRDGLALTRSWGACPIPEEDGYWLL